MKKNILAYLLLCAKVHLNQRNFKIIVYQVEKNKR